LWPADGDGDAVQLGVPADLLLDGRGVVSADDLSPAVLCGATASDCVDGDRSGAGLSERADTLVTARPKTTAAHARTIA
jgi:hypothetical protein